MEIGKMFINGEWVSADSGKTRDIFNPANGELVATVADGGVEETRRAVDAAAAAFPAWSRTSQFQRAALLNKAADIFRSHCPGAEVAVLSGGQPVYYYIISIE